MYYIHTLYMYIHQLRRLKIIKTLNLHYAFNLELCIYNN